MKLLKYFFPSIYACSLLVFVSLTAATPLQAADTTVPGLTHHWSGEEDASDSKGGADGTLGATTAFGPGVMGSAFSFDGESSSVVTLPVNINSQFGSNPLPQMTMGMWVNLRSVDNSRGWVIGHDDGGFDRSINLTDTRYQNGVAGGTGRTPHTSTLIKLTDNLNTWHCVAVAFDSDASQATFYADGSTQTVQTDPTEESFREVTTLGGLSAQIPNHEVDGLVDEVFIFDRVLDSSELDQVCTDFGPTSADIDIKPGSNLNSVNLCSNGAVPIAILGSDSFDVFEVDTSTLKFAEAGVKVVGKKDPHDLCSYKDVNGDLIDDLVCHFLTIDIDGIDGESTSATLNGRLLDTRVFTGSDNINIVKDTCD